MTPNPPISVFALCEEFRPNETAYKAQKGLFPDFSKTPTTKNGQPSSQFNRYTKLGDFERKRATSKKIFILPLRADERRGFKWGSE